MIRVLLVDDSPTSLNLLRHILSADHDLQIVGEAKNGAEAVRQTKALHPNVVLMDIHMPVLDGLQATREIMIDTPTPIVLISASTMVTEVDTAMESLAAGALTLLLKPSGPDAPDFERDSRVLIETVKAMSDVKVVRRLRRTELVAPTTETSPFTPATTSSAASRSQIGLCAIATSTGGPPAIHQIVTGLPANFPVPIVIVQHIAAGFTPGLVNWLGAVAHLPVKIAEAGELLTAGTIYFAPEDRHLGVTPRGTVILTASPPITGFRPSATHLFRSVGEAYRNRALAVILTGMGRDGVDGLRTVRQHGGTIIAQDESTSVVFGMPGAAIAEQLPDKILPLNRIARAIIERTAGFKW